MADEQPNSGSKEATKPPSPKPDQDEDVAPPLVSTEKKGKCISNNFKNCNRGMKSRARIHEQYLDKVTLDLSKGRFFTWLSFS